MLPPLSTVFIILSRFLKAVSVSGSSPFFPPRAATNTMCQSRFCSRDSATRSWKVVRSSNDFSRVITGESSPPVPALKLVCLLALLSSDMDFSRKRKSSFCGSGCCRATVSREAKSVMSMMRFPVCDFGWFIGAGAECGKSG